MITTLRHNYPITYYFIVAVSASLSLLLLLFVLYSASGGVGNRIHALANAIYWDVRAIAYDGADEHSETPATHFMAEIKGATENGHVVFSMASEGGSKVVEAELADLNITNIEGTTKVINRYKGKRIFVDYYQYEKDGKIHNCVVLWDEFDAPVNSEIVERHFAEPFENPPTNIVNMLMASYFWKIFKDGGS